eukprot:7856777-Heterocapsa_arctica.AAC.1
MSQVLKSIPHADNPLQIPADRITGTRYEHPANHATVDFWRSAERNESFRTGTGPPGAFSDGVIDKMHIMHQNHTASFHAVDVRGQAGNGSHQATLTRGMILIAAIGAGGQVPIGGAGERAHI